MFDKNKFALIIKKISESYNNQREFSEKSGINRTYLSQYMNMKLDNPPKPEILERLSKASNGITNYYDLMLICDYYSGKHDILSITRNRILNKYEKKIKSLKLSSDDNYNFHMVIDKFPDSDNCVDYFENFCKKINRDDVEDLLSKILVEIEDSFGEHVNFMGNHLGYSKREIEKQQEFEIKRLNNQIYMCPVYGKISAGIPNWAEECLDGYLPIDPNLFGLQNPNECFFLKVNGESMNKEIKNGAYALIRKQDIVEDGEIAAVLVNGFEATLKKFSRQGDFIILEPMSADDSFKTQIYDKKTQIKILGKYIGKFEMNK